MNIINIILNASSGRAEIESFRWHDMHHHFASKLVMAGVDLKKQYGVNSRISVLLGTRRPAVQGG